MKKIVTAIILFICLLVLSYNNVLALPIAITDKNDENKKIAIYDEEQNTISIIDIASFDELYEEYVIRKQAKIMEPGEKASEEYKTNFKRALAKKGYMCYESSKEVWIFSTDEETMKKVYEKYGNRNNEYTFIYMNGTDDKVGTLTMIKIREEKEKEKQKATPTPTPTKSGSSSKSSTPGQSGGSSKSSTASQSGSTSSQSQTVTTTFNPDDYNPHTEKLNNEDYPEFFGKITNVVSIIRNLGIVLGVIALMIIGIRSMTASTAEKPILKEALPGYILGIVLVVAISALPSLIFEIIKGF